MVRTEQEYHRSEWTWYAGACRNGADYMVRTYYPPTANPNYQAMKFHNAHTAV